MPQATNEQTDDNASVAPCQGNADERAIRSLSARSASACLQSGASFRTQTHRGDAAAAEQPLSLRTTLPLGSYTMDLIMAKHGTHYGALRSCGY